MVKRSDPVYKDFPHIAVFVASSVVVVGVVILVIAALVSLHG